MTKEKVGNKSYLALGNMAFRDGRYDEAIHYYKKCAAKYPELENIALKNKELAYSRVKKSAAKIIPAYKDRSSGIAAEDIDLINSSGLFDPAWYLKKYPAVTSLGEDPLVHYLKIGWQLGYNPSMKFNTKAYLDKNSDIAKVGINPLIHYVKWGEKEGRLTFVPKKCKRIIKRRSPLSDWDTKREELFLYSLEMACESVENLTVSIVMPTHNRGYCIQKSIESVLQQTHKNWQLVIVDDGSDDNTRSIVDAFMDKRITYLKHETCKGVSAARNTALKETSGQWVFFLDSDNQWRPHYLETMLKFVTCKNLDSAYCGANLFTDDGFKNEVLFSDFDFETCLQENYIDLNTFCVKKDLAYIGFDEKLRRLVDWDYILKIATQGSILGAPFIGVDYYDGNSSDRITRSEYTKKEDFLSIQNLIRDRAVTYLTKPKTSKLLPGKKIAVVFHAFHDNYVDECLKYLKILEIKFQLYVTTSIDIKNSSINGILKAFPDAVVLEYPNIGGDIAPFMELLPSLLSYDLVCKIHTKRDVPPTGAVWREYLLQSLLGSTETVNKIIEVFRKDKELNILGPSPFYKAAHKNTIPETWFYIKHIAQAMGIEKQLQKNWGYFAGTMFWIRPRCLLNMAHYLCENPLYSGEYKVDGLPEHAIERLLCLSAVDAQSSRVGLVELNADGHAGILSVLPHERQNKEPVTATLENLAKSPLGDILNGDSLKKQKKIGEIQTNGTVPVSTVIQNNHQPAPRKRIMYFFPDYRVNNAYQTLLYQSNFEDYEIVPGTIDDCLKRLLTDRSSRLYDCVYHLHWLHPLVTPARNVEEAQMRVNNFIDKLHLFIALGGRIIWTIHNVVSHEPKYLEEEIRLNKAVAELSHWIHVHHACVVEATRPYYELPPEKVVIAEHGNYIGTLPCNVDRSQARQELEIPEKVTVFLFLGQIRGYKGIDELLDAYARIVSGRPDCWLVVAGKLLGIDQGEFEKKMAGLSGTLFHPGYVADNRMQFYLKSADVMVLPYKKVLTSGSVFLAMSFGLPVICPEVGLLSHVVRDGENGLMYKADDLEGLYSSMNRFLNESVSRKTEMGARALETAESYCWEDTSRKLRLHIEGTGFGRSIRTNLGGMQHRWFLSKDLRCLVNKRCIAVILHYNNIEDTQNCVEAVLKQGQGIGVVLVSNNESIVDAFQLANLFPQALVVQAEDNIGYAAANNFGLWVCRQLQPEFFWILNPDILVPSDYYQDLLQRTEKWQNNDYFASTIVHAVQPDKVLFCGGEVSIDEGARPGHLYMGAKVSDLPKEPFTCDYLTGANIFGRSRVLEKAGYLPEQYFLYFEETEWFLSQNLEESQRPLIFPDLIVRNYKRSEEGNLPAKHYLYYFIRNSLIFGQKYASGNMELCIGETRKFAQAWLNKIAVHAPQKLGEFELVVERAFEDGRMGRTGRVVI